MSETKHNTKGPIISIRQMNKYYGDFHALTDINLEISIGERMVICGPSGSGKSTLLQLLAGLEQPDAGEVFVAGKLYLIIEIFLLNLKIEK